VLSYISDKNGLPHVVPNWKKDKLNIRDILANKNEREKVFLSQKKY
jgi:hypothetical protein